MFLQEEFEENNANIIETQYIKTSEVKKFVVRNGQRNDLSLIHHFTSIYVAFQVILTN